MLIKKIKNNELTLQKIFQFSDPYSEYPPSYLKGLLEKKDSDLNAIDYRELLNGSLPAGTFEEVAYYLPLSLNYLCNNNDDDIEMIYSWIDFLFVNAELIIKKFEVSATEILSYVFDCLTSKFKVIHMNQKDCITEDVNISSFSYVESLDLLCPIFKTVNTYTEGQNWIEKKIQEMKNGTVTQKKWLYALYEECNEVFGLYLDDEMMLELLDSLDNDV